MCDFCEKEIPIKNAYFHISYDGCDSTLSIDFEHCEVGTISTWMRINYCPMCGKKLEELI